MRSLIFLLIVILIAGCTTATKDNSAILKGNVYYFDQNRVAQPIEGALVVAKGYYLQTKTDASGAYSLSVESEEETFDVELEASKVGFDAASVTVSAQKGKTTFVPDITLNKVFPDTLINPTDTLRASGPAKHITVFRQTTDHIYIKSSGLTETAVINFVVTDAKGVALDEDHKVTVEFFILNGPDGGEYLYPESMETQNGYVYTILNSGTIAGPVQIQAQVQVGSEVIRSLPIRIAIHGGLPDPEHFSVVTERVNIAGRAHFGIIDQVTAFVGDKYSNPVAPGTVVYFASDYCIVEGSAVTNDMGEATVRFISAAPLPPYPLINPFAVITAYTFSDTLGEKQLSTQTSVLLTDVVAPIEVDPSSFTYTDLNQPVEFNYRVHDVWGYPLVAETKITVEATDGQLFGDTKIELRDAQASGPGTTDFNFAWAPGDSLKAPQVYITITVDSPPEGNGYTSTSIIGTKKTE